MKTNKKLAAAIASFVLASVSLASGTFAWYVTINTAQVTVGGSTVATDHLRVGIKPETTSGGTALTTAGWTLKKVDADDVFWPQSKNALDVETTILSASVLSASYYADGYATGGKIYPATSGAFEDDDLLAIYGRVSSETPNSVIAGAAAKSRYIKYTLVFDTVGASKDIYLNEAMTNLGLSEAGASEELLNSIRVGFTSDGKSRIFNPMALHTTTDVVETKVGGHLDLNGDGAWDYVYAPEADQEATKTVYHEIFYGEATDTFEYDVEVDDQDKGTPVSGSNANCFNGFSVDNNTLDNNYDSVLYYTDAEPAVQESFGIKAFTDNDLGTPIATSNASGYATVTVTIWLEGWDLNCTNEIVNKAFSIGLGFISPNQDEAPRT